MRAIGQIMLALATSMGVVTVAQPEQTVQVAQLVVPDLGSNPAKKPAKKAEIDNGEVFVEVTADVKPAAPVKAAVKQTVTFVEEKICNGNRCVIRRRPVTTITKSETAVVTSEMTTTKQYAFRDRERIVLFPRLRNAASNFAARPKLFGSRRCNCN